MKTTPTNFFLSLKYPFPQWHLVDISHDPSNFQYHFSARQDIAGELFKGLSAIPLNYGEVLFERKGKERDNMCICVEIGII